MPQYFFTIIGLVMILTFDLFVSESNQFIFPQMHQNCKLGEMHSCGLLDIVFTNFWDIIMHWRM